MDDNRFIRYYRHILMPQIGEAGQQAIANSHLVLVGLGGLGCPASQYLVASGVGKITLIDHDRIELSNLQRQVLYTHTDIGKPKVEIAAKRLQAQNPHVHIQVINKDVFQCDLPKLINNADAVLDCTDSMQTRRFINQTCLAASTPLVSAAAMGIHGQLVCFDFSKGAGPCYQCVFPDDEMPEQSCASQGVLSPLLGVMGSMQASAALQILMGSGDVFNRLTLFDGFSFQQQHIRITQDAGCSVCSAHTGSSKP